MRISQPMGTQVKRDEDHDKSQNQATQQNNIPQGRLIDVMNSSENDRQAAIDMTSRPVT